MNQADEAWVQKLCRYNAPKLYKVALRRLEDAEATQDIMQEAFLTLVGKIELVKCRSNPVGWLMKAVHSLILQTINTSQNHVDHKVEINDQLEQLTAPPVQILSLRNILPPGLTQRKQGLLIWFFEDGLTYEELSARLKTPILTYRIQMSHAKRYYKGSSEKEEDFSELM